MRILMISKACLVGAYQRKLEELASFPDVDLVVVVPPSWHEDSRTLHLERAHTTGYQLVTEPIAFNGNFHCHFYPKLRSRMSAFKPHIVHIDEEPYNVATFHALWQAKRLGARALWFSWQNLNRHYPLPFRLIERYNLRRADYAIMGSQGAADVWREKGYEGPTAIIPQFGVDPDIFAPSPARRDPARGFVIGYVGRLVPEKGIDVLLNAIAELEGSWRLRIVGAGSERNPLETLAQRLGIDDRVIFEGELPSLRMPAVYQEMDTLVLPSRSRPNWVEQFGRVLIEAMACGIPVIGSDCGEIPNVIADAGLTFAEENAPALKQLLRRVMHDPALRDELARRGRERVLTHFTQKEIARRTVEVYRALTHS